MAGVVLMGLLGYMLLPISALPPVDFPTIQVTAQYPGASPDVMASSVTTPLERQFGQISGLSQMTSESSFGTTTIILQFNLNRDIDAAAQDVQAAINAASGVLPKNMPNPPVYNKVNPADTPILTLQITSDTLPLEKVNDLADTVLAQKLSEVSGVGLVTIEGNQKPAVRVRIDPAAIASFGLGLEDVRNALMANNVNAPKGSFDGPRQSYTINANDQILSAAEYRPVIVAYRNGSPVRLGDIGEVIDNVENVRLAGWVGDQPSVILDIQRQPGANIIETADRVKALLPRLRASIPPSVKVSILTDRTETIRASVARRPVHADAHGGAGRHGDVCLPAKVLGHGDPERRVAAGGHRHVRRDETGRVQPGQPVPDGADDLHRVRRGRRHCDDREHRPLH